MAKLAGRELIGCGDLLEVRGLEVVGGAGLQGGREGRGRRLSVDGIDPEPRDIVTSRACGYYTSDNPETPTDSKCYVIQALMTLYLREDSARSSTLESSSRALKALMTAMNREDPSPFVDYGGNEDYAVDGLKGVRYIKGTPDTGGVLLIDNGGSRGVGGDGGGGADVGAIKDDEDEGGDDVLSPIGITLIAVGAAGILGVALVAARGAMKRRRDASPYAEFDDDEYDDLDAKHHGLDGMTDVDAASLNGAPSPDKSPRFRGDGDGDSIFSGLETPGNDAADPTFVHARDEDGSAAATAEHGYELGLPSPGGAASLPGPGGVTDPYCYPQLACRRFTGPRFRWRARGTRTPAGS